MKIYQAYMDAWQRQHIGADAIPYDASGNNAPDTREYELFRQLYADPANRDSDEPWGLVSWKFEHKAPVSLSTFRDFCDTAFAGGADCAFINPMIGNLALYANTWEQGIHCAHTGIEKVAGFLDEHMDIRVTSVSAVDTFAFCNYFVATRRFWDRYFSFIEQALALLDTETARETEVGRIYSGSGNYERDRTASMRIFVIERLFSSFLLQQESLEVAAYVPTAADYDSKFGVRLGQMLWNFYRIKQRAVETDDLSLYNIWNEQRMPLLADWQINVIWNLDDPFSMPLTREYREFAGICDGLNADTDNTAGQLLAGTAR